MISRPTSQNPLEQALETLECGSALLYDVFVLHPSVEHTWYNDARDNHWRVKE
jgi:hypothetical protein